LEVTAAEAKYNSGPLHHTPEVAAALAAGLIPMIGYIRVSKAREEMISPDIQVDSIQAYAVRTGRVIVEWIADLDKSGRMWNRRIMRAIEKVETGEAKEVGVWKYSRFGRDTIGCALNLGRLNRCGGELQSATEDIDATTAVGRFSRGMLMSIAAFESDRASEMWRETWAYRLDQGLPARGGPRWGYEHVGRIPHPMGKGTIRDPRAQEDYVPLDALKEVCDEIFHAYTYKGTGYRTCAEMLNRYGFHTTKGGPWAQNTLGRFMKSGFSAGLLAVHDPECRGPHEKTGRECPRRVWLPGRHEAIIDDELWEDFKERAAVVASRPRGTRAGKHELNGILWCGHCGARHSGGTRDGDIAYQCSRFVQFKECAARTVRQGMIMPHVLDMLSDWADGIEAEAQRAAEEARAAAETSSTPPTDRGARLRAEHQRLSKRLDRLLDALLDDAIGRAEYDAKRARLLEERQAVDDALAAAATQEATRARGERHVEVARSLAEEWQTVPKARRRELLRSVVERIDVYRESRTTAWVVVRLVDGAFRKFDISYDFRISSALGHAALATMK
jgi:DNA invertase Pin-like site-specific DNA recombinase